MKASEIQKERTASGYLVLSFNGYKQRFSGYTVKEALAIFKENYKNTIITEKRV